MSNQTVYPYGQGGQLPSGYPIADDLVTNSVQQALSAKQGMVLNQEKVGFAENGLSRIPIHIQGNNNTLVYGRTYGLVAGRKYRVKLLNPDVPVSNITVGSTYGRFKIAYITSAPETVYLVTVMCDNLSAPLADHYDIEIPDNIELERVFFECRFNAGETLNMYIIEDASSSQEEVDALKEIVGTPEATTLDLSGVALNVGVIGPTGNLNTGNTYYRYTAPVYFANDTILTVTYSGGSFSPVSLTDASGSSYTPLYVDTHTTSGQYTITVNIEGGSYIAFCYYNSGGLAVKYQNSISQTLFGNKGYTVAQSGKAIQRSLSLSSVNTYIITTPIALHTGDTIMVSTTGAQNSVITQCDATGTLLKVLVFSDWYLGDQLHEHRYTADADLYVVVKGRTGMTVKVHDAVSGVLPTVSDIDQKVNSYYCGIYLYPFRTIVGKRVWLFKDSVASGLKPSYNFQVDSTDGDLLENYTDAALSYLPTAAGTQTMRVFVRDSFNYQVAYKAVNITAVAMPESKLAESDPIDVLFMGDSLIAFNGNLIGAEWYRMLATDDQETHIDSTTGAKQIPTLNICPGKIRLVGEQSWEARYMYAYSLNVLMTGKRTDQYNPNIGHNTSMTKNPVYNPNSTEPDEIGADGFNKRVDFEWYFNNACGEGKYPKLIYLSIGANDAPHGVWDFTLVDQTTRNMVALCKKIKAACDSMAGGESGIKIKVMNHQTYPLDMMYKYGKSTIAQRLLWNKLYDSYFNAIANQNNGISDYVELIDCASRFDQRVGYTRVPISSNVRYNGDKDFFINECCHMNNVGAYNYADVLVDDFLADHDFD